MSTAALTQLLQGLAPLLAQEAAVSQAALAAAVGPALEAARSDPALATTPDLAALLQRAGEYLARIGAGTAGGAPATGSPPVGTSQADIVALAGETAHNVNNALSFLLVNLALTEEDLRTLAELARELQGRAPGSGEDPALRERLHSVSRRYLERGQTAPADPLDEIALILDGLATGAGKGLESAQRIAAAIRELQSRAGGGRIETPAPPAAQAVAPAAASMGTPTEAPVLLIVDDETPVYTAAKRLLAKSGFKEILTVSSPEEALALLDQRPDIGIVMTDFRMPGMNGLDLARKIRSQRPQVAIVIYSGWPGEIGLTAEDHFPVVAKPFPIVAELARVLMAELRRLQPAAQPAPAAAAAIAGALLLVDDDIDVLEITSSALRSAGITVFTAQNADAALTVFDENPNIRVVLTDFRMPGTMNGLELIRELRRRRGNLMSLLVTGFQAETIRDQIGEGEQITLVPKPFEPSAIIELVRPTLQEPAG